MSFWNLLPRPPTPMTSSSSRASRAGISKARRSTGPWHGDRGAGATAPGPPLGPGPYRLQRRAVLPRRASGRSDEPRQRPLWQRTGPQGLYPCLGPVRTLRNADNPGHGQRSALYSRRVADDPGRAAHPRAIHRHRRFHRPCLRRHIPARLSVHPAPWPAAPFRRASCCESSRPIPASTNWPSLSAKSDGSNEPSSSSTGCLTPICSAGPIPA